jgi:hypothetical protein
VSRRAGDVCSEEERAMRDKNCELCAGSGWYGDNGPGIKGNREYVPCERRNPSGSTFGIIMKEPNRKESFHKKYKEFLHEEKLIEERDKYLALLEEAVEIIEKR